MATEAELVVGEKEPVSAPSSSSSSSLPPSSLPDEVEKFIAFFHLHLKDRNVGQIQSIYDVSFHKLTERFYKATPWPSVAVVAPLVDNDRVFLMLYRELYFRHIYSKLNPTLQHRLDSWENYCNLFHYLSTEEVTIDLPLSWLWDIVDEFVYQYQSFSFFRGKGSNRSAEDLQILKANSQVWDTCAVLTSLSKLASKCDFSRYSVSYKHDDDKVDTLQSLGFYSQIALARVDMLMGDYLSAIQILESMEQLRKGPQAKLLTSNVTFYYILGFSYMMTQRFKDACRAFHSLLLGVSRSKQLQSRSGPYDHVLKTSDRVYALLAIIITLSPQRLDDMIDTTIREKYGDKLMRLQQGHENTFEELFNAACPKFVVTNPHLYDGQLDYSLEGHRLQWKVFHSIVQQYNLISTLRSFLRLYTTIPIAKLASYLDMKEEDVCGQLLSWKSKMSSPSTRSDLSEVQFWISNDMIHAKAPKPVRRQADYFITHITKMENILNESHLPSSSSRSKPQEFR